MWKITVDCVQKWIDNIEYELSSIRDTKKQLDMQIEMTVIYMIFYVK